MSRRVWLRVYSTRSIDIALSSVPPSPALVLRRKMIIGIIGTEEIIIFLNLEFYNRLCMISYYTINFSIFIRRHAWSKRVRSCRFFMDGT